MFYSLRRMFFSLDILPNIKYLCSRPHIERAMVFAFQSTNPLTNAKSKLTLNIEVVIVKSVLQKIQKRITITSNKMFNLLKISYKSFIMS